jgi:hypothetical protein
MGNPGLPTSLACSKNYPLPTPADRLFFLLTYLKTDTLQVVQRRLFGMRHSKRLSGNLTTSLLSLQAAFWRYRKAGQERGESL